MLGQHPLIRPISLLRLCPPQMNSSPSSMISGRDTGDSCRCWLAWRGGVMTQDSRTRGFNTAPRPTVTCPPSTVYPRTIVIRTRYSHGARLFHLVATNLVWSCLLNCRIWLLSISLPGQLYVASRDHCRATEGSPTGKQPRSQPNEEQR